jgi:hypothetical protein
MSNALYEAGSQLADDLARAVLAAFEAGLSAGQITVTFDDVLATAAEQDDCDADDVIHHAPVRSGARDA